MKLSDYTLQASSMGNTILCEIMKNNNKIGEYIRYYHSDVYNTFFPLRVDGEDYALYSSNYTTLSLMKLPECKDILSQESKIQLKGFCPVEIYVPKLQYSQSGNYYYETKETEIYSELGFILGCKWGDNYCLKVNFLDLRDIKNGNIFYVDKKLEKKWLYSDFPNLNLNIIKSEYKNSKFPTNVFLPKIEFVVFDSLDGES